MQLETKDQLISTMGISLKLCFHDISEVTKSHPKDDDDIEFSVG